ncbi:MAG: Crp/Fnr family transcriptional regulator [Bacteroidales bacterium]|nr:Crp/Fnr family transcriptional regulator [Bacteroidales bacterium]HPD94726.1 Crp/Fnr family transcriptional regulator [Tenuifilaceae bacterium]HRX31216.1 Crp/Fnr family transcriptional regulator [Tenuifilaceae bacterium]
MIEEYYSKGCQYCSGLSSSIFKSLSSEQYDLLNRKQTCNTYKKGDILYREGSRITGFYCVKSGKFKIYKTGIDYKPQIIAFARTGDITGYRSVLSNEPACTTLEALEDSEVCFIPGEVIFKLIRENPDFSLAIIKLTCKELDHANVFIKDIAQKTVKERLAEILLMLEEYFALDSDDFININLTREDIASIIGTATESVIRILGDLKNERLIELKGKKIKILDKKKIKLIAESILK